MTGFQIQLDWLMVVLTIIIMIMMNHFYETVDWKKVMWCLVSRWARKLALSKTSCIPTAGFELAQNLSLVQMNAVVLMHQYINTSNLLLLEWHILLAWTSVWHMILELILWNMLQIVLLIDREALLKRFSVASWLTQKISNQHCYIKKKRAP